MKRAIFLAAAIGIFWLLGSGYVNMRPSGAANSKAESQVEIPAASTPKERPVERYASQSEPGKPKQSGHHVISKETDQIVSQSDENEHVRPLSKGAPGSSQDMSGQRDAFFSLYQKDFGLGAKEVEGKVDISYPGYEGKFKVQLLIPSKDLVGTPVPIFIADEKNPAINGLGGSGLELSDTDDGSVTVRFGGIRPFFSKKAGAEEEVNPREDPNNITTVLFSFDPRKRKGTSAVAVYFSYESKGPSTVIGKVDYVVRPVSPIGP